VTSLLAESVRGKKSFTWALSLPQRILVVTQQKTEAGKSDGYNIVQVKRTAGSSSNPTCKEKTAISFHLGVLCIVSVCVYVKSLQSCPTLCNPVDCSPPASSVQWDSLGKNTGVDSHDLLQGIFPTQGLHWVSCMAGGFSTAEPLGKTPCKVLLFSHTVVSNPLRPHRLQHAMLACPSPSPEVCPSSCPLHQWFHPIISSSDAPFSFCPQSLRASGTFSQSVDYSHQVTKILELQLQHQSFQWVFRVDFPQDWLVWFPCCPKTLNSILQHHSLKASILQHSIFSTYLLYMSVTHNCMWPLGTIALTIWTFVRRVMSLLFNTLSRFVTAFLPRSNRLLISWLQLPSMQSTGMGKTFSWIYSENRWL